MTTKILKNPRSSMIIPKQLAKRSTLVGMILMIFMTVYDVGNDFQQCAYINVNVFRILIIDVGVSVNLKNLSIFCDI